MSSNVEAYERNPVSFRAGAAAERKRIVALLEELRDNNDDWCAGFVDAAIEALNTKTD